MNPHKIGQDRAIRAYEWLGIALLLALVATVASRYWGHASDDAYITYGYTRQWLETGEFRFNGDVSYGITAPGYAMLVGVVATLTEPFGLGIPGSGTLLSLVCLLYLTGLLWRVTRCSETFVVRLLPLLTGCVLFSMPLLIGLWGSENMVALSLIVSAALMLFHRERPVIAGILAFLAIMTRMDAGLGALMIGLVFIARSRRIPWGYGLAGLLPLFVWLPFLHSQFGTVLPTTLEAKQYILRLGYPTYTLQEWNFLRWAVSVPACWNLLGLAALGLVSVLARASTRSPVVLSVLLWAAGQELLYRQLGIPCAPWYHLASLVCLLVLACVGALELARLLDGVLPRGSIRSTVGALVMVGALGPYWLSAGQRLADKWQMPLDERFRIYEQLGTYLAEHSEPTAEIAMVEIGITAWYSGRTVLDLCGLVCPEVLDSLEADSLPELVAEHRPAYLVDNRVFYANPHYVRVLTSAYFKKNYVIEQEFSTPEYAGSPIRLWRLRE